MARPPTAPHITPETLVTACPNCGQRFAALPPSFCPACGQESHVRPPRMGEFIQQFGGAYLATEGALWRTLKLLFFKPGELTRQYLAGRRKHYVLPLRLYLTVSVLTLLLLRLCDGPVNVEIKGERQNAQAETQPQTQTQAQNQTQPTSESKVGGKANISILSGGGMGGFGLKDGVFFCRQLPDWVCKRAQRRIDIDPKAVSGELERFKERFIGNVGAAMFMLLPSFALWMKLAYWNRNLRYTEHLVFALHVHAFWFLAFGLALAFTNVWWLTALGCSAAPVYTVLAMRRVYGGRHGPRWLRAGLVSLLYLVMLTLVLTLVALWTLLF